MVADNPKRDAVQWKTPLDIIHATCQRCGYIASGVSLTAVAKASSDHVAAKHPASEIQ